MTHVHLRGLTRTYPGAALPSPGDLTLDIPSGELVALLGPSGCGKTTVLRMIAGLLAPTAGDILFDGVSVRQQAPEARGAVMVFQHPLLFPYMTVAANVGFGLRMRGMARAEVDARVAAMLDLVHLPGLGARRPADLSGGQQQRVALARALIVNPRVLLLDEPLSNLDAHLRDGMRDLIGRVQRERRITTIFVTHDREEAVVMADRVALILDGRLRQYDMPGAFYRRPADRGVAEFFGGCNFLPGVAADGVFDCALGRLALPPGCREGRGLVTFRPESVRLGGPGANALTARVEHLRYLGTSTRLTLAIGPARIEALVPPDLADAIAPGSTIPVTLPPQSLWVIGEG